MSTNSSMRDEIDLCSVILVLGAVLLIGGFIAYFYPKTIWGIVIGYPYRDLGALLIVLGVVMIIAGAFLRTYAPRKTHAFYCKYCGTKNTEGAIYCKRCGKKIGQGSKEV